MPEHQNNVHIPVSIIYLKSEAASIFLYQKRCIMHPNIEYLICKDALTVLAHQLTYLFNCSLSTAVYPSAWKRAKVVPLFKGGDREDVNNFRPVSLLPLPGKLLEKIVHKTISEFFDENHFLSAQQGGFRKGHSTVNTIADLTDDLFQAINVGNTTLAAFIDLRKAFDTVDLDILRNKLRKAGLRGAVLDWCHNYLTGRSQCTLANDVTSSFLPITCGVPQGSVLGPLFFLVYVNDLQGALDNCKVKLYADDTVIYQTAVDHRVASDMLQASLEKFQIWCKINKLTINAKKTKLMVFGTRNKVKRAKEVRVSINGNQLQLVLSYKYLGILLDSTLNFNKHIASVINTVLYKITLLSKVKKYLRNDVALQIYKSMILPYLDYGDVIFHKANSADLGRLQRLQNRCLKLCAGHERLFSTDLAHKRAAVPFLTDRRGSHLLNFMYKRKDRKDLLNVREIRTRAHDAPLFHVMIPRCGAFMRSVGYSGSIEWNKLAPDKRNIGSYLEFKNVQKQVMLEPLATIQEI